MKTQKRAESYTKEEAVKIVTFGFGYEELLCFYVEDKLMNW